MALNEGQSFAVSTLLSLLTFTTMQVCKVTLASTQLMTILGGFTGSIFFLFMLTAVGNLEKAVFGAQFQTKLVEVIFCLMVSMGAAATVHRVCASTCFLFSLLMLWTLNRISTDVYSGSTAAVGQQKKKKN